MDRHIFLVLMCSWLSKGLEGHGAGCSSGALAQPGLGSGFDPQHHLRGVVIPICLTLLVSTHNSLSANFPPVFPSVFVFFCFPIWHSVTKTCMWGWGERIFSHTWELNYKLTQNVCHRSRPEDQWGLFGLWARQSWWLRDGDVPDPMRHIVDSPAAYASLHHSLVLCLQPLWVYRRMYDLCLILSWACPFSSSTLLSWYCSFRQENSAKAKSMEMFPQQIYLTYLD